MIGKSASRYSLKSLLKAGTIAGLSAGVVITGVPYAMNAAHAEAVKVQQVPQVPSFADVVAAVSPAVVSVIVKSKATPAANDDNGFSFNFGGPNFDDLPDDHPLKRFLPDLRGDQFSQREDRGRNYWRDHGKRDGKARLRPSAQGSGFFISEDGYLVTNNHVIDDGSAFTVVLSDGTELDAKLIGHDQRSDLAVLKVDDKRKFSYVQFADDSKIRVGDWVVAVGNPFGLGGTVTAGIISAASRDIGTDDDYIQVDAAVNRGNSGGPSFNLQGEVVGINTAIFSPNGANAGIAFAIKASVAKNIVNKLIEKGSIARGWLGVKIEEVNADVADSLGLAEPQGALVNEPQPGSPGDKAGLKAGDVITAIDGDTIKSPKELRARISSMDPGKTVDVSVWRDGKSISVKVTLGTFPDEKKVASASPRQQQDEEDDSGSSEQTLDQLGLIVAPSQDGQGVQVLSVNPESDAADKGIKEGQKITSVNNQDVKSAADIRRIVDEAKKDGRQKALFQIQDPTGNRFVALPVG